MDIATIVNIILCIISFILAVVSVVTVIITLKQNSKMLESESRAYLAIYGDIIYCQLTSFYLIIKNFGKSSALITSFECDKDLSKFAYFEKFVPFSHIKNTSIAPGQSFKCALRQEKLFFSDVPSINFKISYKCNNTEYTEDFCINLEAYKTLINTTASSKEDPLKIISYALQDINKKLL